MNPKIIEWLNKFTYHFRSKIHQDFEKRWTNNPIRSHAIVHAILNNQDWTIHLGVIKGLHNTPISSPKKLPDSFKSNSRDLRGFNFEGVDFTKSDFLTETCFDYCTFRRVRFGNVIGSSFKHAKFISCDFNGARFDFAHLEDVDFRFQNFRNVVFFNSYLGGTRFENAYFYNTTFRECRLEKKRLDKFKSIFSLKRYRVSFGGENQSALNPNTTEKDRGLIFSENRRVQILKDHPHFGILWWFSDFGRSPLRLILFLILAVVCLGIVFSNLPVPIIFQNTWIQPILEGFSTNLGIDSRGISQPWIIPYFISFQTVLSTDFSYFFSGNIGFPTLLFIMVGELTGFFGFALLVSIIVQNSGLFNKEEIHHSHEASQFYELDPNYGVNVDQLGSGIAQFPMTIDAIIKKIDALPKDTNDPNARFFKRNGGQKYELRNVDLLRISIKSSRAKKVKIFTLEEILKMSKFLNYPFRDTVENCEQISRDKEILQLLIVLRDLE